MGDHEPSGRGLRLVVRAWNWESPRAEDLVPLPPLVR